LLPELFPDTRLPEPADNQAMHAEHAIGRFSNGCLARACRVMAGVPRLSNVAIDT
jgi:hypothetical protein